MSYARRHFDFANGGLKALKMRYTLIDRYLIDIYWLSEPFGPLPLLSSDVKWF